MADLDCMKMTAAEFAAYVKELENAQRREFLRRSDAKDLKNIESARLAQIEAAAKAEAKRQFKAEHETFLDAQRKKYGTDL